LEGLIDADGRDAGDARRLLLEFMPVVNITMPPNAPSRPIKHLRWYIGGLLFLSTVINYIDRQTLSVLGPYLKTEYQWTNTDFAMVLISFRVAYTVGQTIVGRVIDRLGTRTGLSLSVLWYSIAAMATSLAGGLRSFAAFRLALGLGEAGNWPGATKAVAEWFPRRETGWAVALFDSGSSVGGALAPWIVLTIYHTFGSWRPAFVLTGALGFVWLIAFRALYRRPEDHPRLSAEERDYILANRPAARDPEGSSEHALPYRTLLRLRQTWGYILSKSFTDPVWFFITDWFAVYLVAKGFKLEESLMGFWVPFLAADLGNFFGGGLSSHLIARGWSVGNARKAIAILGTVGMMGLIPAVGSDSFAVIVSCFAVATFAYAAFSTIILNLPADIFPSASVASVSGMGGTGAGLGTIGAIYLTGRVADRYSFEPILLGASLLPLVALAAVMFLVRNTDATRAGVVHEI
jgi:MFS transporter, ACS family, hexuronate transporter